MSSVHENWKEKIAWLKKFKQVYGDVNVTAAHDFKLYRWVTKIRNEYQRNHLTESQLNDLNELGFDEDNWNRHIQQLLRFKEEFGHANVPSTYHHPVDGSTLSVWVHNIRHLKTWKLSWERIGQLDKIGLRHNRDVLSGLPNQEDTSPHSTQYFEQPEPQHQKSLSPHNLEQQQSHQTQKKKSSSAQSLKQPQREQHDATKRTLPATPNSIASKSNKKTKKTQRESPSKKTTPSGQKASKATTTTNSIPERKLTPENVTYRDIIYSRSKKFKFLPYDIALTIILMYWYNSEPLKYHTLERKNDPYDQYEYLLTSLFQICSSNKRSRMDADIDDTSERRIALQNVQYLLTISKLGRSFIIEK